MAEGAQAKEEVMRRIAALSAVSLLIGLVVLVERELRRIGGLLADAIGGRT